MEAAGLFGLGAASLAASAADPAWGLLLLFASTLFEVRTDTAGGFTVFASEFVFAVVFAVWAARRGRSFLADPANRPLAAAAGLLLAAVFVAGVAAGYPGEAVKGTVRWAEFAGVLLMAADAGARGVLSRRVVVGTLALAGLVLSVHAVLDAKPWLVRIDDVAERVVLRLPGGGAVWRAAGLEHPNALAAMLFPCVAVCAAAWIALPASPLSVAALLAAAAASTTVFLTFSRGGLLGWLAVMLALAAALLEAPARRGKVVRLAALLALTALVVRAVAAPQAVAEQTRVVGATAAKMFGIARGTAEGKRLHGDLGGEMSQTGMAVSSLDDRKLMAETAGRIVRAHPWLGAGPGGWRRESPALWPVGMSEAGILHHPHNLYLLILCETGVIGFAAFVLLVVLLIRGARWDRPWPEAAFRYAWAGILAGFLAVAAFDVPTVHARGMGFAFLLGLLLRPPPPGAPGAGRT